ncbi:MAG TPA: dihydrolipoyl dehydrogenase, partial [Planctomycetota bacterium]|nr:dihydrolipoyl dehydrogenase [Planctomycetota bacterium]
MASTERSADVVVIGSGPGGYVAAIRLAQLGQKTLCVERDAIGGVCLNWGCIPSKAMIAASSLVEHIGQASVMGITAQGVSVDMGKMKAWKDGIVKRLTGGIGELFKRNGVEHLYGEASFVAADRLRIKTKDGEVLVRTKKTLIATGARPVQLPGLVPDGQRIVTSKEALDFTTPPKDLLVVGGGIVGCEIGTYLAKLGSRVTIVELAPQLLTGTDPDMVKVVERGLRKRQITVHLKSKVAHVEHGKDAMTATVVTPDGEVSVPAERILVAVGFKPNTETLNLGAAGVRTDPKGHVLVNERLQSSNPSVFAIGDVIGPPYLAHKASHEGLVAAEVIAGKDVVLDVKAMPAAIFTDPEIATVGLTEQQCRDKGLAIKVSSFPWVANGRALAMSASDGVVKLIADANDDTLLGCHIVGAEASNLIAEAALAIEMGATVADIGLTVHPHPTLSETLMECAHVVEGHAIHIYVPKK